MFEICLGAHDGIIYIIYISEWYLIVMHPALCCWPCWWIWRKEKQNPGQGSEGSNSETQLRSTADSLCVPSFPCWAVQLDCFSVCAPPKVATVVWVCESEMCTAPVCVVVRWQIFLHKYANAGVTTFEWVNFDFKCHQTFSTPKQCKQRVENADG